RAFSNVGHPNIVELYDSGVTPEGTPYIVMELLTGETLEALVVRCGALSPAHACEIMVQVLAGLTAAHRVGIVHGGLEPSNVFVTHSGAQEARVKLLEFSVAKNVVGSNCQDIVLG